MYFENYIFHYLVNRITVHTNGTLWKSTFFFVMKDAYVKRNIKEYKERGRERQKDGKRQQDIYVLKRVST